MEEVEDDHQHVHRVLHWPTVLSHQSNLSIHLASTFGVCRHSYGPSRHRYIASDRPPSPRTFPVRLTRPSVDLPLPLRPSVIGPQHAEPPKTTSLNVIALPRIYCRFHSIYSAGHPFRRRVVQSTTTSACLLGSHKDLDTAYSVARKTRADPILQPPPPPTNPTGLTVKPQRRRRPSSTESSRTGNANIGACATLLACSG